MNSEQYEALKLDFGAIDMVRPFYTHENIPYPNEVTVLICQGNERTLTQLCLESLLRFYPDVKVVVINGSPDDFDSTMYLLFTALKHKNVEVFDWNKENSHGDMMHYGITECVHTPYVLLMDNDTIVERWGFMEGMLRQFDKNVDLFATGTLMLVSRSNQSCGLPEDEMDMLLHAHPSCSMLHKGYYNLCRPARNHGAPLCDTMEDAEIKGFAVESFPVHKYVSHLSGASWTNPRTIWATDHDVPLRPFVTFVVKEPDSGDFEKVWEQDEYDFNIIPTGRYRNDHVVIHGQQSTVVTNFIYDIRFRVNGEYIVVIGDDDIPEDFVRELRKEVVKHNLPTELTVKGVRAVRRDIWQSEDSIRNHLY